MKCPFCGHADTQVKDSRPSEDGLTIRRRRYCPECNSRFTTFERVQLRELVVAKNGPNTTEFFRLFMVPGMAHCGGGIGPDRHDSMTAMVNWVEKGKAPASMTGSRVVNNQVVRTRPLCPYPQVARYSSQGSIDEAANFSCAAP